MATEPGFDDLKQVEEQIDDAKAKAEEAIADDGTPLFDDDEREYHESGTVRPDLDDQTIAPPG